MSQDRSDELIELPEAAKQAGISQQALRKRIRKGSVQAVKVEGRWFLDQAAFTQLKEETDQERSGERSQDRDGSEGFRELVTHLKAQVAFLERELESRGEELRRKDAIIAAFAQRLPELPPHRVPWWKRWIGAN